MGEFFNWYYGIIPRLIIKVGRGYLTRVYFGFSMPLLLPTLLAPWRRDIESASSVPLLGQMRMLVDNLVSRLFGAVVRLATLLAGALAFAFTALAVGAGWLAWVGLPFIVMLLLAGGFRLILRGLA